MIKELKGDLESYLQKVDTDSRWKVIEVMFGKLMGYIDGVNVDNLEIMEEDRVEFMKIWEQMKLQYENIKDTYPEDEKLTKYIPMMWETIESYFGSRCCQCGKMKLPRGCLVLA